MALGIGGSANIRLACGPRGVIILPVAGGISSPSPTNVSSTSRSPAFRVFPIYDTRFQERKMVHLNRSAPSYNLVFMLADIYLFNYIHLSQHNNKLTTTIFIVYSYMFRLTWVIFRLELHFFAMSLCSFWDPRRLHVFGLDVIYCITTGGCNKCNWFFTLHCVQMCVCI